MPLVALIVFIIAGVVFLGGAWQTKSLVALGLCLVVIAIICQFLVHGAMVG